MANHASHAALPYPIKNARFTLLIPYLDADGDPTDPTTPDTEISKDDAAATDTAEEVASPKNSVGMLTLTGAETDCSCASLAAKAASGPKTTLATLYPRVLAIVGSGTLSAGSAGGGTLGTLLAYDVTGCFIRTTGGTGGGGTGGANNQVRKIATYNTSSGAFTVIPNWETTPSTDTTYDVLLPEGVTLGMLKALNPTTAGRTLTIESDGMGHADVKEVLGSAAAATWLNAQAYVGLFVTGTLAANQATTDITGYGDDIFNNRWAIIVNTGSRDAQVAVITDYDSATGLLTWSPAFTGAPSNGEQFILVPAATALAVGDRTGSLSGSIGTAPDSSGTTTLLSRLSATRAGYLDNLSAGAVATAAKLLSYFQSALRKDVTVDADLGGTYDDATDSQEAIRDNMGTPQTGDAFARLGAPAGASIAADIATRASQSSVDDVPTNTELETTLDNHEGPNLPTFTVATDGGNSATSFKTDRTEATNDYWKDALLLITSGALVGQVKKVTAYDGTTKIMTVSGGFTATPADGVTGLLVNR